MFASDIDTEVLEKARSGIYRHEELKNLTPRPQLQRYFMRGTGPHEGLVRVRQELAKLSFCPAESTGETVHRAGAVSMRSSVVTS